MRWIADLLSDESGAASSKRVVGLLASLTVCGALLLDAFGRHADPSLTGEVLALALGALGLTSYDKRTPPPPPVQP